MSEMTPDQRDAAIELADDLIETTEGRGFVTNTIVVLVKIPLFALVVLIYLIFGGLIWMALISRISLIFAVGMVNAALHQRTPKNLARSMDEAIRFFPAGFAIIYRSFFQPKDADGMADHLGIGRMLIELMWCIVFWGGLLLLARELYGHDTAVEMKIVAIIQTALSIIRQ